MRMDNLEIAYTVDLLSRLTESIETYLNNDKWDGSESIDNEIRESHILIKKYFKRINNEATKL
jgi:hypothetical protein